MKKYFWILLIPTLSFAGQITHIDYVSGNVITAAGQNANENAIVNVINGGLDTTNLSPTAGILGSQLSGTAGITGGQIAASTIADGNIITNTITANSLSKNMVRGTSANSGGSIQEIAQGTISSPDFRANAVSISSAGAVSSSSNQAVFIDSVTVPTVGGKVFIFATIMCSESVGINACIISVTRAGTSILGGSHTCTSSVGTVSECTVITVDSPSAGSNTYTLSVGEGSGVSVGDHSLVAFELRT